MTHLIAGMIRSCNGWYGRAHKGGARHGPKDAVHSAGGPGAGDAPEAASAPGCRKRAEILASVDFDTKKYGSGWGGGVTVLRTAIFDGWVRDFLAEHPDGTVVEIGTGLNSRFDRVDNGQVPLDRPGPAGHDRAAAAVLRRHRPAADGGRFGARRGLARRCPRSPGAVLLRAEGVLTYLDEAPVIARLARRPAGSRSSQIAFDTYSQRTLEQQHRLAARKHMMPVGVVVTTRETLESLGLEGRQQAAVTRPPPELRSRLPRRYRYALPAGQPDRR